MDNDPAITPFGAGSSENGISRYEYRTDAPIGDGGFATVYWARDRVACTDVALKILKQEHEANPSAVEAFFRDPHIAERLDHPNIIKIHAVGDPNSSPYFFSMEYCALGDLRRILQKARRFTIPRSLRVVMTVADALRHCHESDLLHGDIKASNILFRSLETPVLSDFGNAQGGQPVNTKGNFGSPAYLSPEVWGEAGHSEQSDLYSLGVVLYLMLTGVLPFSGETHEELKKMHLFTIPPPPSKWRSGITKPLDEIIMSLLEKRAEDRLGSAAELGSLLLRVYQDFYEGTDAGEQARVFISLEGSDRPPLHVRSFPFSIGKSAGKSVEGSRGEDHLTVGGTDPYVSRSHGVIEKLEDGYSFIDVSTNGSWVNGTRIHRQAFELCRHNVVFLGKETTLVIRIEKPEMPDSGPGEAQAGVKEGKHGPLKAGIVVGVCFLLLFFLVNLITW